MLLIEYMNNGYEPIKITSDIDEAFKIYNPTRLQAFYYDDFLGQTGLEAKLNKNEDQRIADFCRLCLRGTRTVFIMTTREYILNQAKATYEKLERSGLDVKKCIVDMSSYALMDRARILYNHLYFRGLPKGYISEVIRERQYLSIVQHKSFNPRVIEWMTDLLSLSNISADEYVKEFISHLDHPAMIWEHAYKYQISEPSKHLLLIVLSLPNIVHLNDCKEAFESLRKKYCDTYGAPRVHNEFNLSLKECEGNFLRIDLASGRQTLQFHNPSIRDYLTYFLSGEIDILKILIQSFIVFDQPLSLWNSFEPLIANPFKNNEELLMLFQKKLANTLGSDSVRLTRYALHSGAITYVYAKYSTYDQIRFIVSEEMGSICDDLVEKVNETLVDLFSNLNSVYDWTQIVTLLRALKGVKPDYGIDVEHFLNLTLSVLPNNMSQVADYRQLAEICNDNEHVYARLKDKFGSYCKRLEDGLKDELRYINSVDGIGALEERVSDIQKVAEVFKTDLTSALCLVQDLIGELEQKQDAQAEPITRSAAHHHVTDDLELIVAMFDTLD